MITFILYLQLLKEITQVKNEKFYIDVMLVLQLVAYKSELKKKDFNHIFLERRYSAYILFKIINYNFIED